MGRLSQLLAFVRRQVDGAFTSEAQIDPGGGASVTALHASVPGDDAHPLPSDTVVSVPCSGSGREVVVGYIDTANEPTSEPGCRRIYARRDDGTIACSLRLLSNGEVFVDNGSGGTTILRIDQDGNVHLGGASGAALIARADRTDAEIAKLWEVLGSHVHAVTVTGSATTQSGTTAVAAVEDISAPTGADKVYGT